MIFVPETRPRGSRYQSFTASSIVHACGLAAWLLLRPSLPMDAPTERPHYSVRLLHLQLPRHSQQNLPSLHTVASSAARGYRAPTRSGQGTASQARSSRGSSGQGSPAAGSSPEAAASSLPTATPRIFVVPELAAVQPVRQTLIQPASPPDLHLKHEVPLPQLVLLSQEAVTPFPIKQFITPPVRNIQPKVTTTAVATAPELGPELSLSNLKVAASVTELTRLPVPATLAAPIRTYTAHAAKAAVAARKETAPPSISVVALSEDPAVPNQVFALPSANQIAPGDVWRDGNGATHSGSGTGTVAGTASAGAPGTARQSGAGPGGVGQNGVGQNGVGQSGAEGQEGLGSGSGSSRSEIASNGGIALKAQPGGLSGKGGVGGDAPAGDSPLSGLAGTTKLSLPKDGAFGVVVLGSSGASPYPESAGALSGKMVYTVYVRVGQRKNWILQYCLAKSAVSATRVEGTRTPLEAPWPYTILRPEQPPDEDYVLVHGNITADGTFEKLALLFPNDFNGKDLLMRSLAQWAFRPAKKDGEPTAVEVLLIIPRETD